MDHKAAWRVACETCRRLGNRYHCTWRFKTEHGARKKIRDIQYVDGVGWRVWTKDGLCVFEKVLHNLRLEHWNGERWVEQK